MRKIVMFLLLLAYVGQAQNPYWVFPPKYVDFNDVANPIKTLPNTLAKSGLTNGLFHASGTLKCYVTNSQVISRTTNYYASTGAYGYTELALVPVPGNCNKFFSMGTNSSLCISQCPPPPNSCSASDPYYCGNDAFLYVGLLQYNNDGSAYMQPVDPGSTPIKGPNYDKFYSMALGFAVSPMKQDNDGPYNYLYIVGNRMYNSALKGVIRRYKITSTGFSWTNSVDLAAAPTSTFNAETSEADLSPNEQYLAWGDQSGNVYIFDVTQVQSSTNPRKIAIGSTYSIRGVEFSANSQKLFFARKGTATTSAIGQIEVATGQVLTYVPNTADITNTMLELAVDGYIYGSNGTQLKGFNPADPAAGIVKTIGSTANPINNTPPPYYGYTLVDQIDGANYGALFSYGNSGGCAPDLTLSGALTGTYQAANTVKSVGAATVAPGQSIGIKAGTYIQLDPGFVANSGSIVYAMIEACSPSTLIDPCSPSQNRAEEEPLVEETTTESFSKPYPNPIQKGDLYFGKKAGRFSLMSSNGQEVAKGSNANKVNIDHLEKGTYILKLDDSLEKILIH